MAAADAVIRVEVAYARPDQQVILPVELPAGGTLEQAIIQSRILEQFPEIDLKTAKVGVFGKLGKLTATLRNGEDVYKRQVIGTVGYRTFQCRRRDARRQRLHSLIIQHGDDDAGASNRRGIACPANLSVVINRFIACLLYTSRCV